MKRTSIAVMTALVLLLPLRLQAEDPKKSSKESATALWNEPKADPSKLHSEDPNTLIEYLSGHGPKDAVTWNFTISEGRRSGEAATIPVPSNWELQGFGNYSFGLISPHPIETGYYSRKFTVPENWSGRRIDLVFDGVMTDATVKVNGTVAGPTHIGAFYQFRYDITNLLNKGKGANNLLEVKVEKKSSDSQTFLAEGHGGYWAYGGIFRPVWLESHPDCWIAHVAIDAKADGKLTADLTMADLRRKVQGQEYPNLADTVEGQVLDAKGQAVGKPFVQAVPAGGTGRLRISTQIQNPLLWTAETPNLYSLRLDRKSGGQVMHTITKRFGFRTFEVRDGQGLFLNGQRILLKGVGRHSSNPDTGRALDPEYCYASAQLIKSMNMNAVRAVHYPPDEAFLNACDELGLYVIDELGSCWNPLGTQIGRGLVREMVDHDVNHPSVLFWDNGNEGGWNFNLDGEFSLYDPQQRRVLHPGSVFNGVHTVHYPTYSDLVHLLEGPVLVMPTEFQHALYDGGGGAGLEDVWKAITASPVGTGGFIWGFADEGVRKDDQHGKVDVFGTTGPFGLLGPRHEKKGSYYAVRDIWSPVQIAKPAINEHFTGRLSVTNNYDFTSLEQCRFQWKLLRYPSSSDLKTPVRTLAEGSIPSPAVAPHAHGELAVPLPSNWSEADSLSVTAFGPDQQELWNWVWPLPGIGNRSGDGTQAKGGDPSVETAEGVIRLQTAGLTASFDPATGILKNVECGGKTFALSNGPRLAFCKLGGAVDWLPFASEDKATHTYWLASPHLASTVQVEPEFKIFSENAGPYGIYKLEISADGKKWRTLFDGAARKKVDLNSCNFPPQQVLAVRVSNAFFSDGANIPPSGRQPQTIKSVRLGYATKDFPGDSTVPAMVTWGQGKDPASGMPVAWLESKGAAGLNHFRWTLSGDGSLRLDYDYALDGKFSYHGITFDFPEDQMKSLRWLGEGPYRVWQNRLRGTRLDVHENAYNDIQPGYEWGFPEFQGYFSGMRWANLETPVGRMTISSASPDVYFRIGTPRINHGETTAPFPSGDLSFMNAIPGVGSKIIGRSGFGPSAQEVQAGGNYHGTLTFRFSDIQSH
jgi:hypothetical protein